MAMIVENLELRQKIESLALEVAGLVWGIAARMDQDTKDSLVTGAYKDAFQGLGISAVRERALSLLTVADQNAAKNLADQAKQEKREISPIHLVSRSRHDRLARGGNIGLSY